MSVGGIRSGVVAASLLLALQGAWALDDAPADIRASVDRHAKANGVPPELAHAVITVESRYNPKARGGSANGPMQIKHQTARGVGYNGSAAGLHDPETNLAYGMKYLAGAYKLAGGDTCGTIMRYSGGWRASRMNAGQNAYCSKVKRIMASLPGRTKPLDASVQLASLRGGAGALDAATGATPAASAMARMPVREAERTAAERLSIGDLTRTAPFRPNGVPLRPAVLSGDQVPSLASPSMLGAGLFPSVAAYAPLETAGAPLPFDPATRVALAHASFTMTSIGVSLPASPTVFAAR